MGWLINIIILIAVYIILAAGFRDEIKAARDRDPAAKSDLEIRLLYSGVHALIFYRIANFFWKFKVPILPRALSQIGRFFTGIEIHPGAAIGKGLFIDHGMGVVVGETSIIGDNVTLFQGATLGGTGKETGKRHPTIGNNVVVGAGAKVLGNIEIGDNSYVGANAVVIKSVPPNATVVGVPAHITKQDGLRMDMTMDHAHVSDPIMQHLKDLVRRIKTLEDKEEKGN